MSGGTGNIVNVAEYMSNVTNTVNNNLAGAGTNAEVKQLMQGSLNRLAWLRRWLTRPQTQKMGKNLESLSKEVASSQPDRRWYDLSLAGIKEAAEALGEIATPILTIVGKLTPIASWGVNCPSFGEDARASDYPGVSLGPNLRLERHVRTLALLAIINDASDEWERARAAKWRCRNLLPPLTNIRPIGRCGSC